MSSALAPWASSSSAQSSMEPPSESPFLGLQKPTIESHIADSSLGVLSRVHAVLVTTGKEQEGMDAQSCHAFLKM